MNLADTQHRSDRGRHAVVAVIVEDNRFLVIRRSQYVRAPGLLCFPGGGIEEGEDFETAVQRELLEELNLPIQVHHHLWTTTTRWGTRLEWMVCSRAPNAEPIACPDEVAEILWLTADELKPRNDLLGSMPDFLRALDSGEITVI